MLMQCMHNARQFTGVTRLLSVSAALLAVLPHRCLLLEDNHHVVYQQSFQCMAWDCKGCLQLHSCRASSTAQCRQLVAKKSSSAGRLLATSTGTAATRGATSISSLTITELEARVSGANAKPARRFESDLRHDPNHKSASGPNHKSASGPKYLAVYVRDLVGAMLFRMGGYDWSLKHLEDDPPCGCQLWMLTTLLNAPDPDQYLKALLSRYSYQGPPETQRKQRRGFAKEATLVGFMDSNLLEPGALSSLYREVVAHVLSFDKHVAEVHTGDDPGWYVFGNVPQAESDYLEATMRGWVHGQESAHYKGGYDYMLVFRVTRWPSKQEALSMVHYLHWGIMPLGEAYCGWYDPTPTVAPTSASGPQEGMIPWEGKFWSGGLFRCVVVTDHSW